ncbi:MAG: hypothetical protein ACK5QX_10175, partial [bacterium]
PHGCPGIFSAVSSADDCPGDRAVDLPPKLMARAEAGRRLAGKVQLTCFATYAHSPRQGGCHHPPAADTHGCS